MTIKRLYHYRKNTSKAYKAEFGVQKESKPSCPTRLAPNKSLRFIQI